MNFDILLGSIASYDRIAIFRHVRPDCDAFGAQFGLKSWLQENFKEKDVRALGIERTPQGNWPELDTANDEWLQGCLAIVVDTANKERVDDQRFVLADLVIKVDHHPNRDPFADFNLVYDESAATCEILTCLMKQESETRHVSKTTAEFLYKGLLTDTLSYKTSNTTAHTLEMGAFLASHGIDIPALNRELFERSLAQFQFATYIQSNYKLLDGHIAFVILTKETLEEWNLTDAQARNAINVLGGVKEFEAWCMFTEKEGENGEQLFDGSLRSKIVTINDIAEQFNGGGHKNASGVKNLTEEDVVTLLNCINTRIHE